LALLKNLDPLGERTLGFRILYVSDVGVVTKADALSDAQVEGLIRGSIPIGKHGFQIISGLDLSASNKALLPWIFRAKERYLSAIRLKNLIQKLSELGTESIATA
jgi:hypothetical protein